MTTIRQLIQTSPAKANELFAKLVDTSSNALKTREKLFAELKDELELLASLEEEHLFPVLRKHKQTKDLVREALNDNKETRKLLAELDATPRESEEFADKVVELRRIFQQHVRDEKKELLPKVLKALSDEEAQSIIENIEAEKAEIEAEKRSEAEERRAEARREREQDDDARQTAENLSAAVVGGAKGAQHIAQTAHETFRSGLSTAGEIAQRSTGQLMRTLGLSGENSQELTQQSAQNLEVVAQSGNVLARGAQDLSREWFRVTQESWQKNLAGMSALIHCRSWQDVVAVQSEFARNNMRDMIDGGRRIAELSVEITEEAASLMTKTSAPRLRRAA
jgi:hypothetical protein